MALENVNVTFFLHDLFCYFGADHNSDSEPYMWVLMFKIDGESIYQDVNKVRGDPVFFFGPGNPGNLLGGESVPNGGNVKIPPEVGRWDTHLEALKFSATGYPVVEIPGMIGCLAVLFEENSTPNDAVAAGYAALQGLLTDTCRKVLGDIDLDEMAFAIQKIMTDQNKSVEEAARIAFDQRLGDARQTLASFAEPVVFEAIAKETDLAGAVSPDVCMGFSFHAYDQNQILNTEAPAPYCHDYIEIMDSIFQNQAVPESGDWAYNLHGSVWAHIKSVPIEDSIPAENRLEVTCVRRELGEHGLYISKIGGVLSGVPWQMSREAAISLISQSKKTFFTRRGDGGETEIIVVEGTSQIDHPFLTTVANKRLEDNLINLPQCPWVQRVFF
jgi:hypothetical protein